MLIEQDTVWIKNAEEILICENLLKYLVLFLQFVDVPAGERLLMPKTRVRPVKIPFLGSNLLTKIVATPMDAVSFLITITKRA